MQRHFAHVVSRGLAARHERVYAWADQLIKGHAPPDPLFEIWARGGGKSTTAEMIVTRVGQRLSRQFGLYVSGTQDQADRHVQSIANLVERIGFLRAVNKFGKAKGWRRNQLRASNGFNVEAIGLDTAARGVKLDEYRPDFIIFDDIDALHDSPEVVRKKIETVTKSILPTGSQDVAILGIQNMVHENSIFAKIADSSAEFLTNAVCHVEKAINGLKTEAYRGENGRTMHRIIAGEATWEGQSLEIAQRQINTWGLMAFREEAQHEVHGAAGYFFDVTKLEVVAEIPRMIRVVRAWDTAATQGGGDYTVGVLIGISANERLWILDVVRAQLSSDNVIKLMELTTRWDRWLWQDKYTSRMPQDPGSAGKRVAQEDQAKFGSIVEVVSGKKAKRAKKLAANMNDGNVCLLKDGFSRSPELDDFLAVVTQNTLLEGKTAFWHSEFIPECRKFREDEKHDYDDQVDAAADATNELLEPVYGYVDRSTQPEDWGGSDGGDEPIDAHDPIVIAPASLAEEAEKFASLGWD